MNAGKLRTAIDIFVTENQILKVRELLTTMRDYIQQAGASDATEEVTAQFRKHYEVALETLKNAPSTRLPPTMKRLFDEIGLSKYMGSGLADQIAHIVNANNIHPAIATAKMAELAAVVKERIDSLSLFNEQLLCFIPGLRVNKSAVSDLLCQSV